MQQVKKTADYTIYKKRSGRYAVRGPNKALINGDDKAKILVAEGLVKAPPKKAPAPAEAAPAADDSAGEDKAEA